MDGLSLVDIPDEALVRANNERIGHLNNVPLQSEVDVMLPANGGCLAARSIISSDRLIGSQDGFQHHGPTCLPVQTPQVE